MRKLAAFVDYIIKELNVVAAENISSFTVIDEYVPSGDYVSNSHQEGICIYDQTYSAVIRIERFPARIQPQRLLGLLACWLLENDPRPYRYKIEHGENGDKLPLAIPDINIEEESDSSVAIELIVSFREPVFAVESFNGEFRYLDKTYRLADENEESEQFEFNYIMNLS